MTVIQAHDFEFLNIWHHRFSFWKFILSNCKASKCDLHNELRIIINLSLFFLSIIPLHYVPRPPLNMATLTSCHKARQNLKQWITCLLHNCPGAAPSPTHAEARSLDRGMLLFKGQVNLHSSEDESMHRSRSHKAVEPDRFLHYLTALGLCGITWLLFCIGNICGWLSRVTLHFSPILYDTHSLMWSH